MEKLKQYIEKNDCIPEPIIKKVKPILENKDFDPEVIFTKSRAAGGIAKWCKSVFEYFAALKIVKPKEAQCKQMEEKFQAAMTIVKGKRAELDEL